MAWRRPGDKPLSEPMLVSLLKHIYVTRPQWVNHQAISIYSADNIFIVLDHFHAEILQLKGIVLENKITFGKKIYPVV